jgi:hypothetical protein
MKSSANIKAVLLRKIASYVHKILKIFGVIESDCLEFLNSGSGMSQTIDSAIAPFVDTFVQFREDVSFVHLRFTNPNRFDLLQRRVRIRSI